MAVLRRGLIPRKMTQRAACDAHTSRRSQDPVEAFSALIPSTSGWKYTKHQAKCDMSVSSNTSQFLRV